MIRDGAHAFYKRNGCRRHKTQKSFRNNV